MVRGPGTRGDSSLLPLTLRSRARKTPRPSSFVPSFRKPLMIDLLALPRVVIENVTPAIDGGRYALKRLLGDTVEVGADIFKDGHEVITGRVLYRGPGDTTFQAAPLSYDYNSDHWSGGFKADRVGSWEFLVEAWPDWFRTWRGFLQKRIDAGQDVTSELLEGASLVKKRIPLAAAEDRAPLEN